MDETKYLIDKLDTLFMNQGDLRYGLVNRYIGLVRMVFNDNQSTIYHFNGDFGGVTVKVTGILTPRMVFMYGSKDKFDKVKEAFESVLERSLIEGRPVR